ncbi:MAG: hypothetical protein HOI23_15990 [Deltaproteobacteria bacterium]|nr:hypothetical protein [Deltaproteobacteria bacterium]MBT6432356.1 hypothetical protein [Deltaproteobacteria bacterium]
MMRRIHVGLMMAIGLSLVACGTADSTEVQVDDVNADTAAADSDSQNEEVTDAAPSDPRLPSTGDSYRDTAQEFALDVVQTYFDEDATLFESLVHDPIYLAGTNTVYTRAEYLEMMLDPNQFPAGQDYTTYTMDDYLSVYDPGVHTFAEASEKFGLPLFDDDGWVPADDEFLFIGFFRTDGVPYSDEFMSISLVMFVVAERDGDWKIVGLIPHP